MTADESFDTRLGSLAYDDLPCAAHNQILCAFRNRDLRARRRRQSAHDRFTPLPDFLFWRDTRRPFSVPPVPVPSRRQFSTVLIFAPNKPTPESSLLTDSANPLTNPVCHLCPSCSLLAQGFR